MPRKRTKKEAIKRIDSVNIVPDSTDINSPRLKMLLDQLNTVEGAAKFGAKALVAFDPLNRLADEMTIVPYPMVAIPAHEMYRLSSDPSFTIYIRGGETIVPTGGNVSDVQEVVAEVENVSAAPKKRRKKSKYHTAYGKAFKQLAPNYKLKSGAWKKNGFKRCASAARKIAKGE